MAEFYNWPRSLCYLITLVLAMCFLAQVLTALASFYRRPRGRGRILESILETLILGHVFAISLLHGQAMQAYDMGLFTPSGHGGLRVASFIAVALTAVLVIAQTRKTSALIVVAAAGVTLPIVERLRKMSPIW